MNTDNAYIPKLSVRIESPGFSATVTDGEVVQWGADGHIADEARALLVGAANEVARRIGPAMALLLDNQRASISAYCERPPDPPRVLTARELDIVAEISQMWSGDTGAATPPTAPTDTG